ncbi:MAG: hypothetical protein Q8R57_16770 [Bacteroidota bacterium]|nr:hypothetical protein [Bacteroidota bacterium]
MQNQTQDSTKPKTFLNYLMFDESMQIVYESSKGLRVKHVNTPKFLNPPLQTKRFFAPFRCAQNDNVFRCKCGVDIGSKAANINPALKMRECRSFRPQGGTSFFLAESIVLKQIFL